MSTCCHPLMQQPLGPSHGTSRLLAATTLGCRCLQAHEDVPAQQVKAIRQQAGTLAKAEGPAQHELIHGQRCCCSLGRWCRLNCCCKVCAGGCRRSHGRCCCILRGGRVRADGCRGGDAAIMVTCCGCCCCSSVGGCISALQGHVVAGGGCAAAVARGGVISVLRVLRPASLPVMWWDSSMCMHSTSP